MKKTCFSLYLSLIIFVSSALNVSADYSFENKLSLLTSAEVSEIKTTLAACADIMSFDIKDYDYDTLFKYVLYTHKNFQPLTDIIAVSGNSSSFGYNNVSLVNSEYIDYILKNVFRVTPQKPPMESLIERGFCYNNGYYYYTGGFNVDFSTQIKDLVGVYSIGGGVTYVVFTDVYTENGKSSYEQSFALLQRINSRYSLLRLGMGEELLSERDIKNYAPFSSMPKWHSTALPKKETADASWLLPMLLFVISVGGVIFVCSVIALIRMRKK